MPLSRTGGIQRQVAIKLSVLARLMRSDFDRRISDVGVTRSQWALIAVVSGKPGATQRQIAELLDMSEASAGRAIDRLCAEGLLERRERDDDKRARAVFMADAAAPILEKLGVIAKQSEESLFRGIDPADLEATMATLDKIYANVTGE